MVTRFVASVSLFLCSKFRKLWRRKFICGMRGYKVTGSRSRLRWSKPSSPAAVFRGRSTPRLVYTLFALCLVLNCVYWCVFYSALCVQWRWMNEWMKTVWNLIPQLLSVIGMEQCSDGKSNSVIQGIQPRAGQPPPTPRRAYKGGIQTCITTYGDGPRVADVGVGHTVADLGADLSWRT